MCWTNDDQLTWGKKLKGEYPIWKDEWSTDTPGDICVLFEAKAQDNIALCFSVEKESVDGTVFEIIIGGWKNTKSVVRTKAQGAERAVSTSSRPCTVHECTFFDFYIYIIFAFVLMLHTHAHIMLHQWGGNRPAILGVVERRRCCVRFWTHGWGQRHRRVETPLVSL